MIRVVEVISDTNIGGAGRLLLTRFSHYDKSKFEESIVLPYHSELKHEFEKIGVEPYLMKYCADSSFCVREIISLYKYFKVVNPDIVNSHGCLSARIAAYLAKVPILVYTRHCAYDIDWFMKIYPVKKFIGSATEIITDKIIAVASAAEQNLIDMGIDKNIIEVIINGVSPIKKYSENEKNEVRKKLNIPNGAFVCGMCARLEDCKGIDTFLRAARRLLKKDGDYYFLIVGKGSKSTELKILADSLGIMENVRFCGFANDITPYINCFDVNINCSRGTETSSLSLSEGMSIGLPCIVSNFGGNPYMVRDGYNGFVFQTDDFVCLGEYIDKLKNDKDLYEKMSANSYARYCEELTAEKMTRKTEEFYTNLFFSLTQDFTKNIREK